MTIVVNRWGMVALNDLLRRTHDLKHNGTSEARLRVRTHDVFKGVRCDSRIMRIIDSIGSKTYVSIFDKNRISEHHVLDCEYKRLRIYVEIMFVKGRHKQPCKREVLSEIQWCLDLLYEEALRQGGVLNIGLSFFPEGKRVPVERKSFITPHHVNSGVTIRKNDVTCLAVVRKEEWQKVLLHEMLHYCVADLFEYDRRYDKNIASLFGTRFIFLDHRDTLRLQEAYVETVATLLYAKKAGLKMRRVGVAACRNVAKLLYHYGFEDAETAGRVEWRESTHVFSYYVVKACLVMNMRQFMRWQDEEGMCFGNRWPMRRVTEFCDLVEESLTSNQFHECVSNEFSKVIRNAKKKLDPTLKMLPIR
jgi:hypothetical protein